MAKKRKIQNFISEFNKDIKLKSQGKDVIALQELLKALKYEISDPRGYFGKATEAAVLEIQKKKQSS